MANKYGNEQLLSNYFERINQIVENFYEGYISYIEMCFSLMGKNRDIFDKNNTQQIDTFNAFMSGYEKAKVDFGIAVKEPSDIYF